jgi:hypothetical protein
MTDWRPVTEAVRTLTLEQSIRYWHEVEIKLGDDGRRLLALADRYYLLVRVLGRKDALHPWIYARCRDVEGGTDDFLDLWAREHYKSTVITFAGSIQEIIRDPEITIGIFSHTRGVALKFWQQLKLELETNQTLKSLFPDIFWPEPQKQALRWSEQKGLCVKRKTNPKEATLEAWGLVDGQPTGAHFRLRIYDDVVTRESVTTPDQIAKTTSAWELSDNLGMSGGRKWHIGTRYHFGDTYAAILERGALKVRLFPATDDGTPDGNPVLLSKAEWEDKKTIQGPATIACQMLQNPIAGQQAMFDVRDLQLYEVRPATLNVYVMIDPARSTKKGSANTAMSVVGVDSARNKYLLDGINHRLDLKGRWENMRDLRKKWQNSPGVQNVYVGYETFGAQSDMDYFNERMEVERESFPIVELAWPRDGEGSKDDRVQRLGPDFRSHKFFLPAIQIRNGKPHWWKIAEDGKTIEYREFIGQSSVQRRIAEEGSPYRIASYIGRADSDGNIYDVSKALFEQVMFYPFSGLKDFIDATSRIYDMEPRPPIIVNEQDLLPEAFDD